MSPQEFSNIEDFLTSMQVFANWLPDGVMASDIDCCIHAARPDGTDAFLVLEFKRAGQRLPLGQRRLLDSLRKHLPNSTVVTAWLKESNETVYLQGDWEGTLTLQDFGQSVLSWWQEQKGIAQDPVE